MREPPSTEHNPLWTRPGFSPNLQEGQVTIRESHIVLRHYGNSGGYIVLGHGNSDGYVVLGNGNSDVYLVLGLGNEGLRRRAIDQWIRVWWYVRGSHRHRQWGLVEKWSERWKKRKRQLTTRSLCAREAMPRVSSRDWDSVEPRVRKSVVVVLFPRATRMYRWATLWSKPALEERRQFRLR